MSSSQIIKSELADYHNRYLELTREAAVSTSHEPHFEAALLAPTLRLMNLRDFESTFDQILFHLENAYQRAPDEAIRSGIRASTQLMVESHLNIIENWISSTRSRITEGLALNTRDLAGLVMRVVRSGGQELPVMAFQKVLGAYLFQLSKRRVTKKEVHGFYVQLVHLYNKVLNSPLYTPDQRLLMNSFLRVRDEGVLKASLEENGLALTTDMLRRFGMPPDALGRSLHMAARSLEAARPPLTEEALYELIDIADRENLPNRHEIRREVSCGILEQKFSRLKGRGLRGEVGLAALARELRANPRLDRECISTRVLAQYMTRFGPRAIPFRLIMGLNLIATLGVYIYFIVQRVADNAPQTADWLSGLSLRFMAPIRGVPVACGYFLLSTVILFLIYQLINLIRQARFRRQLEQFEDQLD
jgi:hypothetical protein